MKRADFVHFYTLTVRWSDLDALGHVNNVQFLRYLESGRIAYCNDVLGLQFTPTMKQGWILAEIRCTFHQQLMFPNTVEVATRSSRLGTRSGELTAAIFKMGSNELILSSDAVMVWFDYEKQMSLPIPADVREAIRLFEKNIPNESAGSRVAR